MIYKFKHQSTTSIFLFALQTSILLSIFTQIIPMENEKSLPIFNVQNPPPKCAHWRDQMPKTRQADAYHAYIKARILWRKKSPWELSRREAELILHDVNFASQIGDWGARALMEHFYLYGLGDVDSRVLNPDPEKAIEIMQQAVAAEIPFGYYDLGTAYESGYGTIKKNKIKAWSYYLRAAELGSPEAQITLAEAYIKSGNSSAENLLLQCAFSQKHGPAAYQLGINSEIFGKDWEAINYYQKGIQFGCESCASSLSLLFSSGHFLTSTAEKSRTLGIKNDQERAKRYDEISDVLTKNPDLRLEFLDKIVPLPPTPLPAWHGVEDAIDDQTFGTPTY